MSDLRLSEFKRLSQTDDVQVAIGVGDSDFLEKISSLARILDRKFVHQHV
ncbi:putative glycerophosphodiester phosphodiesterase domain-containing protein [Helianthus anomalus]